MAKRPSAAQLDTRFRFPRRSLRGAGSDLCRVAASSDWKVGSGAATSRLGWEAADPIVIRTSWWVVSVRKIKMAAAEFQESLKKFLEASLDPNIAAPISFIAGRPEGPGSDRRTRFDPPVSMLLIGGCGYG